jgi:von Willebrand factor type A domain/Aerotolerance regulator N-terminal
VSFAGLPLMQLLWLFGAAGLCMGLLYVLKLRRRRVTVPFLPLWSRVLRDKDATTLFSKLKRILSLLLQLLLLALLVLALGDPRAQASIISGRSLVVLVDASASMQATDIAPSRFERARQEVRKLAAGIGASDRMLIAQMGARTVAVGPMSQDPAELERAAGELTVTDSSADFARGLRFAQDALAGLENPEIVVVSDGALPEPVDASGAVKLGSTKLSLIAIGKPQINLGITQFSVRRYPLDKSRYEVMLEVASTSEASEEIELSLFGDGQLIDVSRLTLKPKERLPRFYPSLTGASKVLEAHIKSAHDTMPADNRAFALLPERKHVKLLLVTAGNTYLEAGLLLDDYVDVEVMKPTEYVSNVGRVAAFDVVVFDGVTPVTPPAVHALYIDPRGDGSPVKVGAELSAPGFDKIDRKHPLLRYLALDDVNIGRGHKLTPGSPRDKVVGGAVDAPLLIAGERNGKKFVALGFDPRDSDLPMRMAWPLFLVNVLGFCVEDDASYIAGFRNGQVVEVSVPAGAATATLVSPDGKESPVAVAQGKVLARTEMTGIYTLKTGASEVPTQTFATNLLDLQETLGEPKDTLSVSGKEATALTAFSVGVRRDVWLYLLALVVAITAIEWATYHRRITV